MLLQLFEGNNSTEDFLASQNLFTVSNRQGFFACGCRAGVSVRHSSLTAGIIFGKTESLREAFEEAKPKSTALLQSSYTLDIGASPTHLRFTADGQHLVAAFYAVGLLIFDTKALSEKVLPVLESSLL